MRTLLNLSSSWEEPVSIPACGRYHHFDSPRVAVMLAFAVAWSGYERIASRRQDSRATAAGGAFENGSAAVEVSR